MTVSFETDVNPEGFGGFGCTLFDELIESQIVHHPSVLTVAGGYIGNVDVNGFTRLVLTVGNTTYGFVQGWTVVA